MEEKLESFVRHGIKEKHIEVSADEILNAIAEGRDIDIWYADIHGDLDIGKCDGRLFIEGIITISNSEIHGNVNFVGSTFSKEACFHGTDFIGDADFANANFKIANFSSSIFKSNANFYEAKFDEQANFYQTSFSDVDFSGATFMSEAFFYEATLSKKAFFAFTYFRGSATFSRSSFKNDCYFNNSIIRGNANFIGTSFFGIASFRSAAFMGKTTFESAEFVKELSFHSVTIDWPATFRDVHFRQNSTVVVVWNYIFHPLLCPIVWLLTLGMRKLPKLLFTDFLALNTNTVIDTSSNPYLKRYIDDEQWISSWRSESKGRRILFFIWELTSHCGRSFFLWMSWSLILALIFGFFYKDHINIDPHTANNWYTPFYFSVVTFTTLGFGDVKPMDGIGQFLITLEVLFGYLMLGGLLSIFANKFARRS